MSRPSLSRLSVVSSVALGVLAVLSNRVTGSQTTPSRHFQHRPIPPIELIPAPTLESFDDIQMRGQRLRIATRGLFPANRYADSQCGGVFVGPQVYLTAAHCLDPDNQIVIDGSIMASCKGDPQYTGQFAHDFAPCFIKDGVKLATYETVDLDQSTLRVGDEILLSGYGGNSQTNIGVDLVGETTLKRIDGDVLITEGGVWINKNGGDSGSASMSVSVTAPSQRRVIAVNSAAGDLPEQSKLASLAGSKQFLSTWVDEHKVQICGLNYAGQDCHP